MDTIVFGRGPKTATWMIVGEAPGREEAAKGRPFVGRSGQEQDAYLSRHGLSSYTAYVTNVVKEYRDGNPDPTREQIEEWTPVLLDEIDTVRPRVILAVGRFAARWFLGDGAEMEAIHGLPHRAGAFDPSRRDRARGAVVVPVYHPAYGFYDGDMRAAIAEDYARAARIYKLVTTNREDRIQFPYDDFADSVDYRDVTGRELERLLRGTDAAIGFDTEGTPGDVWSIQVSPAPGTGWLLRTVQPDFQRGIRALQDHINDRLLVVLHNAMYDVGIAREVGLELRDALLWDTMYAAYLLRLEPQGLKPLAYRWLGVRMQSYDETVGAAGVDRQVDYLAAVLGRSWPKPEPYVITDNAGRSRLYRPQSVERRALSILAAVASDSSVDVRKRWLDIDEAARAAVESEFGPMPVGTLADIPLDRALHYAVRDADVTLRLYDRLTRALNEHKLTGLMDDGMDLLPVFEEMQDTGMHATRRYFTALYDDLSLEMERLGARLSHECYGGKPFNPGSGDQVAALMRRRGLRGEERTSTGKVSTAKKSIEHLKDVDKAIGYIMEWRERQKVRDAFCKPVLSHIPPDISDDELYPIRCRIKVTRVQTRRLAAADPNMLAFPAEGELAKRIRSGFVAPPGQLFGAWDLSQIELRYLAHTSQDAKLCKRFCDGADIHSETAAEIFRIPVEEVDKMKHRWPAKRAGFGIVYGISGVGLMAQLRMMGGEDWTVESCDELIEKWLESYPGVRDYIVETRRRVRQTGEVRDRWGMIRYLPGAWSHDGKTRAEAERTAVSHEIQGGAQGMIQNSMRWLRPIIRDLQREGHKVHWVLQVHDEVILRFDEGLKDLIHTLVIEALTQHHGLPDPRVPIEADGNTASTWSGLK